MLDVVSGCVCVWACVRVRVGPGQTEAGSHCVDEPIKKPATGHATAACPAHHSDERWRVVEKTIGCFGALRCFADRWKISPLYQPRNTHRQKNSHVLFIIIPF